MNTADIIEFDMQMLYIDEQTMDDQAAELNGPWLLIPGVTSMSNAAMREI